MRQATRDILSTALTLLVFSMLGAGLLSGTFGLTRETIVATERAIQQRLLAEALPAGAFDNDLTAAVRPLPASTELGPRRPGQVWLASKAGVPVGVVMEVVAPDGYSGDIRMLVGILADGRVSGVRVTAHRETPGLGDYIEASKSDWVRQFAGRALDNPPAAQWRVRKDGGRFDYMAGATITPRAVVKAVRRALEYFAAHRVELLGPKAQEEAS